MKFRLRIVALMLIAFAVRVLRPIITIRFGHLLVSRLGHLAGNTECYLCERDAGINSPKRSLDIWTPIGPPANEQLFKMYARVIPVWRWASGVTTVGKYIGGWEKHHTFSDTNWARDIHNLMEKSPPHIKLTAAEELRGAAGLAALGMPADAKWVCIICRDPTYLQKAESRFDWSYHAFRDSSVDNYREAAVALMERGYWVLRMGASVAEPMKLSAPRFIDYATSGLRSDFMDVYLGGKCAFTISNSTGFDAIPMVFRRPICFVNEGPFEYLSTWMKDSMAIWKHHFYQGKRMSPAQIVASGAGLFLRADQFEQAGITLIENTPTEIKDVALEMDDRLQGIMSVFTDDELQRKFWAAFPRSMSPFNGKPLHGEIRLRIGSKFLADYAD